MSLAERFKAARARAGLSQVQVSEAAGVHQSVISDIERGVTLDPGSSTLLRIANLVGIDPSELLFGTPSPSTLNMTPPVALENEELEDQQAILRVYLRLSSPHKRVVLTLARALRDAERAQADGEQPD